MTTMRNMMKGSVAILLTLLASCDFVQEGERLDLKTDQSGYEPGTTINIVASNRSKDVIYYNTCMPTVMQELSDGEVAESVEFPTCACLCVEKLLPGKSWAYQVDGTWLWQNLGPTQPKIGPRYRFSLKFYADEELQKPLDASDLVTNTFRFKPHTR